LDRPFQQANLIYYNSEVERTIAEKYFNGARKTPSEIVGVGINIPALLPSPLGAFRQKYNLNSRFLLYLGRVEKSKGCDTLCQQFLTFKRAHPGIDLVLVLVGEVFDAPSAHPDIFPVGFVSIEDKQHALAECLAVVVPSPYESLSLVLLEGWSYEKPALINGSCQVLAEHNRCAKGGAWEYTHQESFNEGLMKLLRSENYGRFLGKRGRKYVKAQYSWPTIIEKYQRFELA
jgi:glycosyltransferase involved in cell wall biosynthesis